MAIFLIGLLLAPATGPAASNPAGAWILTCDMPRREAPTEKRVFRLAPKVFQEWNPTANAFGYNLCSSFPCVARPDRIEGVISSPSLSLTIELEPLVGRASWRAQGASGLSRSSGSCSLQAEKTKSP